MSQDEKIQDKGKIIKVKWLRGKTGWEPQEIKWFIQYHKYLLSSIPGTILGTGDTTESKQNLCPYKTYLSVEKKDKT